MNNVVNFKEYQLMSQDLFEILPGKFIKRPKTRLEYLEICKKYLTIDEYESILCCIMDNDYFNKEELVIQKIVDSYFSFSS